MVSYFFPPNPDIGSRRWAKFAKYLAKAGYSVHVITTPYDASGEISNWTQDVDQVNIIRHEVPSGYPELNPAKSLLGKIRNRLTIWRLFASTQGTIYDKSIFWHAKVLNQLKLLIKQTNIQTIIATGAPFHMLSYLGGIKKFYPDVFYAIDFRDPWTLAVNYGIKGLSNRRLAFETAPCSDR
ncbi:MAG: hypothetical protein AAF399_26895, partial [Bacteroidota bacterium]